MSIVIDVQELASQALSLLDAGDVPAARALLAAAAESAPHHDHSPSTVALAQSERLARSAATCAMGADLSMTFVVGVDFANGVWPSGAIIPAHSRLGDQALLRAESWSAFLKAGPLAELKSVFVRHPENLRPARRCLTLIAGMPEQIETCPSDAIGPLFRTADDVWGVDDGSHTTRDWLSRLLSVQMARREGGERATRRLMYWAAKAGVPQREVADWMGKPQTYVFRQLKAIELDPSLMTLTPREIYEHHVAREIDRPSLLALLAAYPYEPGSIPDEEPYWGYVPGSLDELTQLASEGRISPEELEVVLAGIEAMAGQHE
ncbi:hypothetical protein [Microbacterium ureisolvens]|uniref:Uncharacterized protein n=1 Tax=Microbacterium ureisolvens TaxID=2781186 RepID=A0ABS7I1H9_9MICO|nr:hypothetical protein [Microbacterium ureisolvens]MBW9110642.1 hypothetical protein [Microbacterium ureisolvens]